MEGDGYVPGFFMLEAGQISTHALTWRATSYGVHKIGKAANFYPRPHMEGDMLLI